jgi:hypothetical protein
MFQKVIVSLVLALVISSVGASLALAEPNQSREVQPGDYFWYEAVGGSVGALAGGFAGGVVGATLFCPKTGCTGFQDLGNALVGYLVGNAVGGAIGTVVVGAINRVQGNLVLAVLGAAIGDALGLLLTGVAVNLFGSNAAGPATLLLIPAFSGLGAAIGYNVGASLAIAK